GETLFTVALGTQRVEYRHGLGDIVGGSTDHESVPLVPAPDTTGNTGVDIADIVFRQQIRVRLVVGVLGVTAVDDKVAALEQLRQLGDRVVCGVPRRNHHPDNPGRVQ